MTAAGGEGVARRLSRSAGDGRPAAPVRHVHLGLGNFFRAHQAWYSDLAPDAADWGIAAFTGRSAAAARAVRDQDGLYTLVTRDRSGDRHRVVASVSAAHEAAEHGRWLARLAAPATAVVTLTVTEAAYRYRPGDGLDLDDPAVRADLAALRSDPHAAVSTVPARLAAGLAARRGGGAGPLAVIPCDNLPDNGAVTRAAVSGFAHAWDGGLGDWVDTTIAFVSTVVDRITPRPLPADLAAVRAATGVADAAAVVTEPFSEWVLSGAFPAGRPAWDAAGAVFAGDVAVFERRKLWLLNGAHSLLAYAGPLRRHRTVADALADAQCRDRVERWWDEAARHLDLPAEAVRDYRRALVERFANPRVRHELAQIANDGSQKLPVRVVPVLRAERAAGREAGAAALVVAAWLLHLRGAGAPLRDVAQEEVTALAGGRLEDAAARVVARLAPDLADDAHLHALVAELARELSGAGGPS